MIRRAIVIVFFSLIIGWVIWLVFSVQESKKIIGEAQVKIAMADVKTMREALDALWYTYNLDGEQGKTYTTESYDVFKNKIKDTLTETYGEMPVVLPSGKNFTDFSYTGNKLSYHIQLKAKDNNGTLVRGTPEKIWHE